MSKAIHPPPQITEDKQPSQSTELVAALPLLSFAANDLNPAIRQEAQRLQQLSQHRLQDFFSLTNLCAMASVDNDNQLVVHYVNLTVSCCKLGGHEPSEEKNILQKFWLDYQIWLFEVTEEHISRNNASILLWSLSQLSDLAAQLFEQRTAYIFSHIDRQFVGSGDRRTALETATDSDNIEGALSLHTQSQSLLPSVETAASETDTQADIENELAEAISDERIVFSDDTHDHNHTHGDDSFHSELSMSHEEPLTPTWRVNLRNGEDDSFGIGDTIDQRYTVKQILKGGMGLVYMCYDHNTRLPVTLKTFQNRFLNNEKAIARFTQEALTWIRLEKHQHVVQALKVQKFRGRPYIILESILGPEGLGPDLRSWIDHQRLTLELALRFALHISLGMQYASQQVSGLVHRDLKPANILVRYDGIAKITDFGLVRSIRPDPAPSAPPPDENRLVWNMTPGQHNPRLTRAGSVIGTAQYMSPEQAQGQETDPRSDIYAFGCLLYEMLTWQPIFRARTFEDWKVAHTDELPGFPPELPFEVPRAVQDFVLACVAKSPEQRPANWDLMVETLHLLYSEVTGQKHDLKRSGVALEAEELVNKAYSLTEIGYPEEALLAYDRALELEPNNTWTLARKARTLRLVGDYETALGFVNAALGRDPHFGWGWSVKGQIQEKMGRLEVALAAYKTASEIMPEDVWVWYNQAGVLFTLGRQAEALIMLDHALQIDPRQAFVWAKRGQVLRSLNRHLEALNAYNRAIELNNSYPWAWNGKGLSLKALGRYDESLNSFQMAAQLEPDQVWHWYNQAEILVDLRRYEKALAITQQAAHVEPGHAYSWGKQGQVLRYMKRYEEALQAYEKALDLRPDYAWAINGMGIVYERMGRYEEAFRCYRQASYCTPSDVWHWYNQGNLLILQNRAADAIPILERATQIDPQHAHSWARLGSAHRLIGNHDVALVYLDRALKNDPNYSWGWNEQGVTLEGLQRYEKAAEAYGHAAINDPGNPLYWYNQAKVLVVMRRFDEALTMLERTLRADARYYRAWAKRGQVLRRLNDMEAALQAYNKALEIAPDYAWAWNGHGLALSALGRHAEALESFQKATVSLPRDVWFLYNQAMNSSS